MDEIFWCFIDKFLLEAVHFLISSSNAMPWTNMTSDLCRRPINTLLTLNKFYLFLLNFIFSIKTLTSFTSAEILIFISILKEITDLLNEMDFWSHSVYFKSSKTLKFMLKNNADIYCCVRKAWSKLFLNYYVINAIVMMSRVILILINAG